MVLIITSVFCPNKACTSCSPTYKGYVPPAATTRILTLQFLPLTTTGVSKNFTSNTTSLKSQSELTLSVVAVAFRSSAITRMSYSGVFISPAGTIFTTRSLYLPSGFKATDDLTILGSPFAPISTLEV